MEQERTHVARQPGKALCGHRWPTKFVSSLVTESPTCGNCRRILRKEGRP